jgi:hypothetical protein
VTETPMQRCDDCTLWDHKSGRTGICRAHAPVPGGQPDEIVHWPETYLEDGCGDGVTGSRDSPGFIRCSDCAYWHQPNRGEGLAPMDRQDEGRDWWANAGHCRRHAPNPSATPGPRGFWRATHGDSGCAEGKSR